MAVLHHLSPQDLFSQFEQLCAIPHGSFHTKAISDYLADFARQHNLPYTQDEYNNVIITKPASAGYENAAPVIIQGHMDMVCEKATDCQKDMLTEGLDLVVDGDLIYAKGTTLGGDDGIAVAVMLALLAGNYDHPALECIFTSDEEVGMLGAAAIDLSALKGRRLLNLDSEVEGIFTVSCAGGATAECVLPIQREVFSGTALTIAVTGLQGGHSGVEIDKGRANANILIGRVLYRVAQATEMRIISINGGLKENAIPLEAKAHILVKDTETATEVVAAMNDAFQSEYAVTDSNVQVCVSSGAMDSALTDMSTKRVLTMLQCLPNGIQTMSADIEGLVQTSLNLGILQTTADTVSTTFSVRSSIASQKQMLLDRLDCLMTALGGHLSVSGDYPGWQYRHDSPLRDLMVEVFNEQYGYAPKVEAIHAGLECGMFNGKLDGLDCVSYGPDLKNIHTCRETMSISSVQRVWAMTLEILRRMK